MLQLRGVFKSYGGDDVLAGLDLQLNPGERIALVGPNGAGKSTLLRVILGEIEPDRGAIQSAPGTRLAYLPQDARFETERDVYTEVASVLEPLHALERQQRELEAEMSAAAAAAAELDALIERHHNLQLEFEHLGGHTATADLGRVLAGLGFTPEDQQKSVTQLSGGWQMRVALAQLLLRHPDVLLLDEPTNHLDLAAVDWLEDYLASYLGGVIIVSHDRYFLDRVATRTVALERGQLEEYSGNFSFYVAERARRRAAQELAARRQQEYLEKQQEFIERFRASARRSTQAKSREKLLARIERIEAPDKDARTRFSFAPCQQPGRETLVARRASKAYGSRPVLDDVGLVVERGSRLGIVGPNGAGKSTLLRLLAGVERPDSGAVHRGTNVELAYFTQHQSESLNEERTVFDEVFTASRVHTSGEVRGLLARFLFRGDEVFKPVSLLSGGERSRVALAKLLLKPANVLLLDEPTNHLDVPGREALEDALSSFDGVLIVASHDRYFLDKLVTQIVEIENGRITVYTGNYSAYRAKKRALALAAAAAAPRQEVVAAVAKPTPTSNGSRRGSRSPARELEQIEAQVGKLEQRQRELADLLAAPDLYADHTRTRELQAEYEATASQLADLNQRWEELAELILSTES